MNPLLLLLLWNLASGQDFGLAPPQSTDICPSPTCYCLGNKVDCSNRNLTSVPQNLPSWTQELDLSGNLLVEVVAASFPALPGLKVLALRSNNLKKFPSDLWQLGKLEELNLRDNLITKLDREDVVNFRSLRVLNLGRNRLRQWPDFQTGDLSRLRELYLEVNRISKLSHFSFNRFTQLRVLKLTRNRISVVKKKSSDGYFANLSNLSQLDLSRNKITHLLSMSFKTLESLDTLKLNRNGLEFIEHGTFWGLAQLKQLQLRNNAITNIEDGWLFGLSGLEKLYLADNQIGNNDQLQWNYCPNLRYLDISNNQLRYLPGQAFALLTQLEELYLSFNQISDLTNTSFASLHTLEYLDLSHNMLAGSLEDTLSVFSSLFKLVELNLSHNRIQSVSNLMLKGLLELRTLDLLSNPITTINRNALKSLKNLSELKLNTSRLVCDCHVDWLVPYLTERNLRQGDELKLICGHPPELAQRSLWSIQPENLTCGESPKPKITEGPEPLVALRDGNATFRCVARSSSSEPAQVIWKRGNLHLVNDPIGGLDIVSSATKLEEGLVEIQSELRMFGIAVEDADSYQCIIGNKFGSDYSSKVSLTVQVFPSFIKKPKNDSVVEDNTIRLDCHGVGLPEPTKRWIKDGNAQIPAAEERRIKQMPEDNVMLIVEAKLEDEGRYTCILESPAGSINATAFISVKAGPLFRNKKKEVVFGKTAVLSCDGVGTAESRTHIKWYHNSVPLMVTPRHSFVSGNKDLIIENVRKTDDGTYRCKLNGQTMWIVQLDVTGDYSDKAKYGNGEEIPRLTTVETEVENEGTKWWSTFDPGSTPGIVIITVSCCAVLISFVWVLCIYCFRRRAKKHQPLTPPETATSVVFDSRHSTYSRDTYPFSAQSQQNFRLNESMDEEMISNRGQKRRKVLRVTENMLGNPESLRLLSNKPEIPLNPLPAFTYPRVGQQLEHPRIMMLHDGTGPYVIEDYPVYSSGAHQTSSLDSGVAGDETEPSSDHLQSPPEEEKFHGSTRDKGLIGFGNGTQLSTFGPSLSDSQYSSSSPTLR